LIPANTISLYRNAVQRLVGALDDARALELVIQSQGGAATMFAPGDFVGSNTDIDIDKLTSAITSRQAIETLVTAGGNAHLTNLNRMLP
jgi:hypothetical protein